MPNAVIDKNPVAVTQDLEVELRAWFAASKNRTAEEITAARQAVFTKEPFPLPTGKSLEDVFVGALPDEKSDAEISAALSELE